MKNILCILFLFLVNLNIKGQGINNGLANLKLKLQTADSVSLISHKLTSGVIFDEKTGISRPLPNLLEKGLLNINIIKEKRKLDVPSINQLTKIITRPSEDRIITFAKCYFPHHTILIYNKSIISYIEICFSCHKFKTSDELTDIGDFDKRKWKELFSFFKQNKMKYELDDEWEG